MLSEQLSEMQVENNSLESKISALSQKISGIEAEILNKETELNPLRKQQMDLENQRKALGVFKFKERKQIDGDLSVIRAKINNIKDEVHELKSNVDSSIQEKADTQCELGICYNEGNGVEKDPAQAVFWFRKATELEHAGAQCGLGLAYILGNGVEENFDQGIYWLKKSADLGNTDAINILLKHAYNLYHDKQYSRTFPLVSKLAELGNAEMQSKLGLMYEDGKGVDENKELAIVWQLKAAENGLGYAQHHVANLYILDQDYRAFQWSMKALHNDNLSKEEKAEVKLSLAMCYAFGIGVDRNRNKSRVYAEEVIQEGYDNTKTLARKLISKYLG